jgi:hypothetical protein
MISKKLVEAVKLSDWRAYRIAHKAGLHPSTLSRILNGIEEVEFGDPRILRLAKVLGLNPDECFEEMRNENPSR